MFVILSGVAGAGKDTIKKELIKRMENVESLPSFTSRPMRPGDVEGGTYYFVTKEEFEEMLKNEELYEYDVHHNHYYGSSKKLLNEKIASGKVIVKDIDVNGTEKLKELLKDETRVVTIFLRVPKAELKKRLENEESRINIYDYVLKNNDLEKTVQIIMAIIQNELRLEENGN